MVINRSIFQRSNSPNWNGTYITTVEPRYIELAGALTVTSIYPKFDITVCDVTPSATCRLAKAASCRAAEAAGECMGSHIPSDLYQQLISPLSCRPLTRFYVLTP